MNTVTKKLGLTQKQNLAPRISQWNTKLSVQTERDTFPTNVEEVLAETQQIGFEPYA